MSELIRALLDGDIRRVRSLLRDEPGLMSVPSAAGTLPLDLARKKGRIDAEVALFIAGAPSASPARSPAELLRATLAELSQDHAGAGWLDDLEYLVWASVVGRGAEVAHRDPFGLSRLGPEAASELGELARRAGGWTCWEETAEGPVLVTMETWLHKYDLWRMADLRARVAAALATVANTPLANLHGLTAANLGAFTVDPYQISVRDDDGVLSTAWVVVEETKGLLSGYGIAFDPAANAWLVVERAEGAAASDPYALVIQAESLVGALNGM